MTHALSAYANTPFWWEDAAPTRFQPPTVPRSADVAVIGAGYAGLCAALTLARAGRSVVVFDRQFPGFGGSSRNGGIASGNIRPSMATLLRRFGQARALAIEAEAMEARRFLAGLIAQERLDCDFQPTGRFLGATGPVDYEAQARAAELLHRTFGVESYAVPRARQHDYIGTEFYHGGSVRMDIGGLHPAKFHAGLLNCVTQAGALVIGEMAVTRIVSQPGRHDIHGAFGSLTARDVMVCTNAYTDGMEPWLRRRIVPVRSRIIATEPLPAAMMQRLMPGRMMYGDKRELGFYFRPSPDGQRVLFGGRDGATKGEPAASTMTLFAGMTSIFPELSDTRISHSWYGYVAMHRDMIPRIFTHQHRLYATGFCGSGVVWAPWVAARAARKLLGQNIASAFDMRPPAAIPLYRGKPYFMPAVMAYYQFKDWQTARHNASPTTAS